ncbi:MAG: extracellular solute-binding protein [Lachnospiraceae bacterium]|nr:extracellular solute-binding protein [Lachnospiraceae bacterium]
MRRKKWLSLCMAAALLAGCTAGCGDSGDKAGSNADADGGGGTEAPDAAGASQEGDSDEIVTIKYVTWYNGEEELIEQFEKEHPNIKVDLTVVPDSGNTAETLDVMAMGGGEIDVWPFQSGGQFARMQKGLLLDIGTYLDRDGIDMKDWFGDYEVWGQYNGNYYGLPSLASVGMVFYNKDMFDELNVPYPTEDWTIEDYYEIAGKLTKGSGGDKRYGTFTNPFVEEWGIYGCQVCPLYDEEGMCSFSADNEAFAKSLELRKRLDDSGYQLSYAQTNANWTLCGTEFLAERCAMTCGYSWMIQNMKDTESYPFDFENIGLCYFPRLSEEAPMKPSQVALEMIGIPASSKHPDEAWEFIKFYIQNGSMKSVADGKVPAYQKLDKTELAKLLVEGTPLTVEQGAMFFEDDLHTYTAVPGGLAAGDYKTIIQEQTGMYFLGEQELEETMTNIKEQVDAAIRAEMEAE